MAFERTRELLARYRFDAPVGTFSVVDDRNPISHNHLAPHEVPYRPADGETRLQAATKALKSTRLIK